MENMNKAIEFAQQLIKSWLTFMMIVIVCCLVLKIFCLLGVGFIGAILNIPISIVGVVLWAEYYGDTDEY